MIRRKNKEKGGVDPPNDTNTTETGLQHGGDVGAQQLKSATEPLRKKPDAPKADRHPGSVAGAAEFGSDGPE